MDIPTAGPPIACELYPLPIKYQKCVHKEIRLLENAGCMSKCLSLWAAPVIIVLKKPDPLKTLKTTASLSFRLPVTQ